MNLESWLASIGLEQYSNTFRDNAIDTEILPELTDQDLASMGVLLGHRKKMLKALGALNVIDQDASADAAPPAKPASGERREVTVLFADLAGFTKLSSELGAEETHKILNRYFETVDQIIEAYGGSVDKHMGDNVMAVFGAPLAHSDDPERAVRAADEIHQALARLSAGQSYCLRAHIGIASGQVVASGTGSDSHREYTVTGDSVNLASRLEDLAEPGQSLLSDRVRAAVAPIAEVTALGVFEVKGFAMAVQVWRLDGLRHEATPEFSTPFVGRTLEVNQFSAMVENCLTQGLGQSVLVRGEAGMGKSRLVEQFAICAREQGFSTHKGLVLDFGVGKGQDAIRTLVRSLLSIAPGSGKQERSRAARAAIDNDLVSDDHEVFLNDLLDLPQERNLSHIYNAMDNATRNSGKQALVSALIQRYSARQPLLLIVEDIHWAEPLLLQHLARTTETVANCPAILVMTSRIEGDPLDQNWRTATRSSPCLTLDLAPLRTLECFKMAEGLRGATKTIVERCVERAEGNPLFLDQLLRNAMEDRNEEVPGSIQSLVLARIDRLPPEDKAALQAASVLGQRFDPIVLCHLLDNPDYSCQPLIEHFLVRPEGDMCLFTHALIRQGVYSSLLSDQQQALHRQAAKWFANSDPALRAEHLEGAKDPAAPVAYLEAAAQQLEIYHYDRALKLTRRGLDLATDQGTQFDLLKLHGDVLRNIGATAESIETFRKAMSVARDEVQECRARIGLAEGLRVTTDYAEALEILGPAESAAKRQELVRDLAQIHHLYGNLYFSQGAQEKCLHHHQLSHKYAEQSGQPEALITALGGLGDAEYARGHMISARDYLTQCIEQCRRHGFGRVEVANLGQRAITAIYSGELNSAQDDMFAAIEAAQKIGHLRAEMNAQLGVCHVGIDLGDYDLLEYHTEKGAELAQRLGAQAWIPFSNIYRAWILYERGQGEKAIELHEQASGKGNEAIRIFAGAWWCGSLAVITDSAEARAQALAEGEAMLAEGCLSHNYLWFYRHAIDASLMSEDWENTDRYCTALEDYTSGEPLPWSDYFIARGRALAAFGRGHRDRDLRATLGRLVEDAKTYGVLTTLPPLEAAIASFDPSA